MNINGSEYTGRQYKYDILDCGFEVMRSGVCTIIEINYDKLFHYHIYYIEDVYTKTGYTVDSAHLILKEE